MKVLRKAVPVGYCKTCRWNRELPDDLKMGPFVVDCQAQPFVYEMFEKPTNTVDAAGKKLTEVGMRYRARPHTEHDFCAFFEDRPEGAVDPEEVGGPIYGAPMPPMTPVPRPGP